MTKRLPFGLLLAFLVMTTACVSTHMKKFVGRDVGFIEFEDGAPIRVFDLPEGQRAFQYLWGGGQYVVPKTTTTKGQLELVGDKVYYTERRLEAGGYTVDSPGCVVTYLAKWDQERKGWIVVSISYPKQLVC